jgi:hypothetical protein
MSWHEYKNLMALANLLLCSGIGWVCICRAAMMSSPTTRKATRVAYSLVCAAAGLSGWSPWFFGDWPGWASLAMSGAVLAYMFSGMPAWRDGLPDFARSGRTPLDELHHGAPK